MGWRSGGVLSTPLRSFAFFATRPQKLRFEPRRVRKRIGLRVRPNRKRGTEAPRPNGLSSAHSSGWTGGRAADVVGVDGAAAGASVRLRVQAECRSHANLAPPQQLSVRATLTRWLTMDSHLFRMQKRPRFGMKRSRQRFALTPRQRSRRP